jgi:hypothetical protein
MAAANGLREDFDASALRAIAKRSDCWRWRRFTAAVRGMAEIGECQLQQLSLTELLQEWNKNILLLGNPIHAHEAG